ncbi:hypothetical protein [Effusibacillus consociatus]|uniref:Nucleic acid-binding protein n=1 Tax=Effusibacillus consociatus TaxID=1117041 RepID=A0ABV9Q2I1_9BACL
MDRTCSKCGVKVTEAEAICPPGGKVILVKSPFKNFASKKESSPLHVYACPSCGLVEWYAEKPENLSN